jgi:hypothetical protein
VWILNVCYKGEADKEEEPYPSQMRGYPVVIRDVHELESHYHPCRNCDLIAALNKERSAK